ncbi:CAP Gly-rich domain-containing protein [Amylostereum chailletii]|nr:CAP Gly-rich domain-containing protein [Amylostereum chailletii]
MSNVTVFVSSLDTRSELRFDLYTTISQLKGKLELITGIPVANQRLEIYDGEGDHRPIQVLADDDKPLGFYGIRDWQLLKVEDTNPSITFTGQLTDVTGVEKFELTEEQYAQRGDSILAYKQRNKVGRFAPKDAPISSVSTAHLNIPIGARCQVESTEEDLHKRGTVRFVGPTKFGGGTGVWVGVEYDMPFGKNDGSVAGERYFECRMKYGAFVRPEKVQVGDFPVEELDLDDEEM